MIRGKLKSLIDKFKDHGLYSRSATFEISEVDRWEAEFGLLPAEYKDALLAGSYDKGAFHFIKPYRLESKPSYLVFAVWNDDLFAFDLDKENRPVMVVAEHWNSEVAADSFVEWFERVYDMTSRPVVSG